MGNESLTSSDLTLLLSYSSVHLISESPPQDFWTSLSRSLFSESIRKIPRPVITSTPVLYIYKKNRPSGPQPLQSLLGVPYPYSYFTYRSQIHGGPFLVFRVLLGLCKRLGHSCTLLWCKKDSISHTFIPFSLKVGLHPSSSDVSPSCILDPLVLSTPTTGLRPFVFLYSQLHLLQ